MRTAITSVKAPKIPVAIRKARPMPVATPREALKHKDYAQSYIKQNLGGRLEDFRSRSQKNAYLVVAQPKSEARAERKPWPITDMYRASIIFDSMLDLKNFWQELRDTGLVVREKDYFQEPKPSGLRFAKLVFDMEIQGKTIPWELQLQLHDFWKIAKDVDDHHLYEARQGGGIDFAKRITRLQQADYCPIAWDHDLVESIDDPCFDFNNRV